ncbi:UNVERIFIED_CONTAM: Vinorine synthase [Sesamum radiatum]|uniref:Vinorine synthase n=1 Tax=Sesamum radiatum TaxID=300843 RepID=A0AAW2V6U7_SESRA
MVQINLFECGGVAIGVCMSHLVADASSLVEFMNAWAATCRGENPKSAPEFGVMARYFPAQDLSDSNISPSLLMGNDKLVTKRFVFNKEKLAALKQAAATGDGSDVKDPTRVEAVSAPLVYLGGLEQEQAHILRTPSAMDASCVQQN